MGDNVIVGKGSLLITRNKQLSIKFDDSSTLTFEYPSEEALLAEPDTPPVSPVPARASDESTVAEQAHDKAQDGDEDNNDQDEDEDEKHQDEQRQQQKPPETKSNQRSSGIAQPINGYTTRKSK